MGQMMGVHEGAPLDFTLRLLLPGGVQATHLKNGRLWWTMPSLERSLALMKRGSQPAGRESDSTANPWFWEVRKQRPEPTSRHGWLWPRFPYLPTDAGPVTSQSGSLRGDWTPAAPLPNSCQKNQPTLSPPVSPHFVRLGSNGQG